MLRLHKGYSIPQSTLLGRKFGPQFAGPFRVLEHISQAAYRVDFPSSWKIHDVVSVAHLEPAPPLDPFGRLIPGAGPITYSDHARRILAVRGHGKGLRYLVDYDGLGPEHQQWIPPSQLDAQLLAEFHGKD